MVQKQLEDSESPAVVEHGGQVFEIAARLGISPWVLLDFSSNVNPLGPSSVAIKAIVENAQAVGAYPERDPVGLKNEIASFIGGITSENVVLGNGSTELIYGITKLVLNNGGDALGVIPTFGEYERAVSRAGGVFKQAISGENFVYDESTILDAITASVRLVFVCNPNNPTGFVVSQEVIDKLVAAAREKGFTLVLDEDSIELSEFELRDDRMAQLDGVVILRSFTKLFGLPGLRIGYAIASPGFAQHLSAQLIPWNVNTLAQIAAKAAFGDLGHVEQAKKIIRKERPFLLTEIQKIYGLEPISSACNHILIRTKNAGVTGATLRERLIKHQVLVRDCSSFRGLDQYYIRVSVKGHTENLRLLAALSSVLNR